MAPQLHFQGTMKTFLLALLLAGGCIVGGGGGDGDGTGGGGGGGGGGGTADLLVDGGSSGSATCSGAAYDPCSDPSQCMSGKCQLYDQSGFQVCTTTCTPGDSTTCPQQNGQPAQCNMKGLCKPTAANSCTR